jgi:hypothetical protein
MRRPPARKRFFPPGLNFWLRQYNGGADRGTNRDRSGLRGRQRLTTARRAGGKGHLPVGKRLLRSAVGLSPADFTSVGRADAGRL